MTKYLRKIIKKIISLDIYFIILAKYINIFLNKNKLKYILKTLYNRINNLKKFLIYLKYINYYINF